MGFLKFFVIFAVFGLSYQECDDCKCKRRMRECGIIPEYADKVCSTEVTAVYTPVLPAEGDCDVKCGNDISMLNTGKKPNITFAEAERCKKDFATVLFFNIDSPDSIKPDIVWAVVNVPKKDLTYGNLKKGKEIYGYIRPLFAQSKELPTEFEKKKHRYVYFIYCQNEEILADPSNNSDLPGRLMTPRDFAKKYNLCHNPVAGTFFNLVLQLDKKPASLPRK